MAMKLPQRAMGNAKTAAESVQNRRGLVGYAMPRTLRAKLQAVVPCQRKKPTAIDVHSPLSQEEVHSPTGRVALGPWLGPFNGLAEELPATLYLDSAGSAHTSLDDDVIAADLDSAAKRLHSDAIRLMSRMDMQRASPHWSEAQRPVWSRSRGANAVRSTHQIKQARPRSMMK